MAWYGHVVRRDGDCIRKRITENQTTFPVLVTYCSILVLLLMLLLLLLSCNIDSLLSIHCEECSPHIIDSMGRVDTIDTLIGSMAAKIQKIIFVF